MPTNHSYFIAITLPEPLHSEIASIKKNISEEYGTRSVLKSPPHITIIPPFFWGNEAELIELVGRFSFPSFRIRLSGYQAFEVGVVYIDVEENDQVNELHRKFNEYFFEVYPQLKKRYPFPFHPHVTVGNRDWKWEKFKQCWDDIKNEKYAAEFEFIRLALLKNVNGLWTVLEINTEQL